MTYISKEAFYITQQVKLIDKNEFAKMALVENINVFMIYIIFLRLNSKIIIHLV